MFDPAAAAPLILTLRLDDASFHFFDNLRQQHFPPERNFLKAHLTLFHHLPWNEPAITRTLKEMCRRHVPWEMQVTAVVSIGRGVAFKIESPTLQELHKQMQQAWQQWLIPQDRQKLWPHITVQNKVDGQAAAELHRHLASNFQPFAVTATGLSLWAYQNGPWKWLADYPFVLT